MNTPRVIATYSRVSTGTQEDQKTVQIQLGLFKDAAEERNYEVYKDYVDDGWTSETLARPALDELRQDARKGLFDAVLIYDPDRLARKYSYQELVEDELKESGVEVIYLTVSAPKTSEEKILFGVRGLFAEYEKAKIKERFRLGKLRRIKDGNILVSQPLFGYSYVRRSENVYGHYVINEEEAGIVRLIFSLVSDEGLTLRRLIVRLHDLGIKPRRSKRGVWSTSTLTTMLRHKGYIGEAHWGSSTAVIPKNPLKKEKYKKVQKSSRVIKPESEWMKISIPPIIDRELFERAQVQLEKNASLSLRNTKNEYLLSGKIRCICGNTRAGEGPQRGKHLYYRCTDRVNSFPLPHTCNERSVNVRIADERVWDAIYRLHTDPQFLLTNGDYFLTRQQTRDREAVESLGTSSKEIKRLEEEITRYNKAYGAGVISIEQLIEYTSPLKNTVQKLTKEIELAKSMQLDKGQAFIPSAEELQNFTSYMTHELKDVDFAKKREVVRSSIDKIIGTSEKLLLSGSIHVNDQTSNRHGMNTIRHFQGIHIPFTFEIMLNGN